MLPEVRRRIMADGFTPHQAAIRALGLSPAIAEKALWRYAQMQRRKRAPITVRATFGARFHECSLEDRIPRTIHNFGVWEPNTTALFESILKPGDVCADIGANIGYYSLLAAKLVGADGGVVAIEASPAIFTQLSTNIERNGANVVRALNVAASDAPGEMQVYSGPQSNRGLTSTIVSENLQWESTVAAAPLDELLTAGEIARLGLIKIDIEGGEVQVLRRLASTIDLYPRRMQIIAELSPVGEGAAALAEAFAALRKAGFEAYAIENDYGLGYYLRWRGLTALTPLNELPDKQVDVLFRRPDVA